MKTGVQGAERQMKSHQDRLRDRGGMRMVEEKESWSGPGGACPLLVTYCKDMDSLYKRRMAFRYSHFMLAVGIHVCACE